jgi:hypothetical protein
MTEEVSELPRCRLERQMWNEMDKCWQATEQEF